MANKNSVAIFSIDPGVTTGCACGLFDLRMPTVHACMRRARSKGNIKSWEVLGDHVSQSWEIVATLVDWHFKVHVERGFVAHGRFYLVQENFIPRQIDFDPMSMFVIGGVESLLMGILQKQSDTRPTRKIKLTDGDEYIWYERQEPGERWGDDKWLKENGLWVKSIHERDARRHIATKLNKLL